MGWWSVSDVGLDPGAEEDSEEQAGHEEPTEVAHEGEDDSRPAPDAEFDDLGEGNRNRYRCQCQRDGENGVGTVFPAGKVDQIRDGEDDERQKRHEGIAPPVVAFPKCQKAFFHDDRFGLLGERQGDGEGRSLADLGNDVNGTVVGYQHKSKHKAV